ncbi:MAG: nicotinate (nicotinamide) nucleotide adenylyltransferase [Deltaproteobacteria bacterium RIFCSPLOWO2_12_FULL_60_19]|nr:MAG: nicotinate (nicotinamide) nucleotide adenylyltransferase [Deltaproteobacteria bacterium RIFCSPLOWO2_12_FULL_60_19]
MKLGLFGGTFDPIHWGHLRSAEEVREAFGLDWLLFIPASMPPHKAKGAATPARDRLKMVRLAIAKNPGLAASSVEIDRPGKSYSIDTLRYFAGRQKKGDALYFILGRDAFEDIGSWKEFRKIFPLCHLIVTSRPGCGAALALRDIPIAARKLFCYDPTTKSFRYKSGTYLHTIKLTDIAISASEIRARVKNGKSIRYLVPAEVEAYIRRKGLYRGAGGA